VGLRQKLLYTDEEAWAMVAPIDSWVFNKLYVARMAGVLCGPRGITVPNPDHYVVRPITNISGCGLGARKVWFDDDTSAIHPGEFWAAVLEGEHLSIDYKNGQPVLSVRGIRADPNDLVHWQKWEKCKKYIMPPDYIRPLLRRYPIVNCEYIDGTLIEVHLRGNPDFIYGNEEMIPVWEGQQILCSDGWKYIPDVIPPDMDPSKNPLWELARPLRVGILIR
jgi:hypothetical protein